MTYYCNKCKRFMSYEEYDYSKDHFDRPLCIECQDDIRDLGYSNKRSPNYDNFKPSKPKSTPQAKDLYKRLNKIDVKCELEHWDGNKHIDIAILWAKLYVEVDGMHHLYSYHQRKTDEKRDFYSAMDGFETLGVLNKDIEKDLYDVADWIAHIAKKRNRRFSF